MRLYSWLTEAQGFTKGFVQIREDFRTVHGDLARETAWNQQGPVVPVQGERDQLDVGVELLARRVSQRNVAEPLLMLPKAAGLGRKRRDCSAGARF